MHNFYLIESWGDFLEVIHLHIFEKYQVYDAILYMVNQLFWYVLSRNKILCKLSFIWHVLSMIYVHYFVKSPRTNHLLVVDFKMPVLRMWHTHDKPSTSFVHVIYVVYSIFWFANWAYITNWPMNLTHIFSKVLYAKP